MPIAKGAGRSSPGPRELVGLKALVASSCQAGKGDQGHREFAAWPCLGQPGRSLWAAGDASPHFLCFAAPPSSHTAPAQLLPQPLLASRLIMATCTKAIITETSTVPSTPMRQTPISKVSRSTGWIICGSRKPEMNPKPPGVRSACFPDRIPKVFPSHTPCLFVSSGTEEPPCSYPLGQGRDKKESAFLLDSWTLDRGSGLIWDSHSPPVCCQDLHRSLCPQRS